MGLEIRSTAPYTKRTLLGYEVVKMMEDPNGHLHVIVKRSTATTYEGLYVVGFHYDPERGEWGQGHYGFNNIFEAIQMLNAEKGECIDVKAISYQFSINTSPYTADEYEFRIDRILSPDLGSRWCVALGSKEKCKEFSRSTGVRVGGMF